MHFIRRLPKLTPEELEEMEALNPKSPEEWQQLQEEKEFLQGSGAKASQKPTAATPHKH